MLFDRVEKHLEIIAAELREEMPGKQILVITGDVENDDRNIIKAEMENGDNIVLLASYGTMSTGVSIKKLHNLVFCHPSKSVIRVLQSLGRLLRLHDTKDVANIYDIVDVASFMGRLNHAMRHAAERLGFYQDEQHQVAVKRFYAPDSKSTTTRLL
jgi:superfamily II DNA or RNA helicase